MGLVFDDFTDLSSELLLSPAVRVLKTKHIIIATDEQDSTADAVIIRLREMGHAPVRLHPREFMSRVQFSIGFDGPEFSGKLCTPNRSINLEDIGSVWWRRPKPPASQRNSTDWEPGFVESEIHHATQGLWSTLDCYWMSFPARIKAASWKPGQLKRAAALGFDIPRTVVTTQADEARQFYERCQHRVIYKPLSSTALAKHLVHAVDPSRRLITQGPNGATVKVLYTTLLNDETFNRCVESLEVTPCLLQEYIPKKSELRVTIIGDDIFVAEIDSQAQASTKIDWRHYDVPMIARKATLPADLVERCIALVKGYGLQYSAMDFIRTPDDRYVFLESNPNGQCLFIERLIPEYKLTAAIASCLINGLSWEAGVGVNSGLGQA